MPIKPYYFMSKTVVSSSLEKLIESEGKEVNCTNNLQLPKKIIYDREWKRIAGTRLYTYSAYYDFRLQPYRYIRIIAMSKGNCFVFILLMYNSSFGCD